MGYHLLDPDGIEPTPGHPCDRRSIGDAAGLAQLALAVYELAPGEQLSTTYHYHETREEFFYVLEGELAVETPERTYAVGADRCLVVGPESPIRPYNPADADGPVRVLGAGAPRHDIGRSYEPDG